CIISLSNENQLNAFEWNAFSKVFKPINEKGGVINQSKGLLLCFQVLYENFPEGK
ncbi:hypothetical protein L9F63_023757, partial [Diploptera punctata]